MNGWLRRHRARQKWIDQSQSLNLFIADTDGKKLDAIYKNAWLKGLKTTYYLRSTSASNIASNGVNSSSVVLLQGNNGVAANDHSSLPDDHNDFDPAKVCNILDSDCESCQ